MWVTYYLILLSYIHSLEFILKVKLSRLQATKTHGGCGYKEPHIRSHGTRKNLAGPTSLMLIQLCDSWCNGYHVCFTRQEEPRFEPRRNQGKFKYCPLQDIINKIYAGNCWTLRFRGCVCFTCRKSSVRSRAEQTYFLKILSYIGHYSFWHFSRVKRAPYHLSYVPLLCFPNLLTANKIFFLEIRQNKKLETPGIDPGTSRMLSERSTIWATSPHCVFPTFLHQTKYFSWK